MRSLLRTAVISLILLALASTAAAEKRGYSRFGFYVGGGFSYAKHLFEDEINDLIPEFETAVDDATGFHVMGGLRLLPFLAIEGEYERVASFVGSARVDLIGRDIDVLELKGDVLTGNVKLIIPTWWAQPYVLGGIGNAKYTIEDPLGLGIKETQNAFAGRIAGGIDLYLSDAFVVYGEFGAVLTTHDIDNPTSEESISGLHYLATKFGARIRF